MNNACDCYLKKPILNEQMFTQINADQLLDVPKHYSEIEQILSVITDVEISYIKVINTMEANSNEGQILTGKKLFIQLHIKQKILYLAGCKENLIHALCADFYQITYIVVPKRLEGTPIDYFINNNHYNITVESEDVSTRIIDKKKIYMSLNLLIKFVFTPSYELCYSEFYEDGCSDLFLSYENGSHVTQITCNKNQNNKNPSWSPNGYEIAYLSNIEEINTLYITNYKTLYTYKIAVDKYINSVGNFCWSPNGRDVVFSACNKQCCELFISDKYTCEPKRLTFSDKFDKNFRPIWVKDRILFLRTIAEQTDIWSIQSDGKGLKKVTENGTVKSFDCTSSANTICYICSNSSGKDDLYVLNYSSCKSKRLKSCGNISIKKNVKFSPNCRYISFIGTRNNMDNIVVIDICEPGYQWVSDLDNDNIISDYVWSTDSDKLYFSVKESTYGKIYSVEISTCSTRQIFCNHSCRIELSYRPMIG